MAIGTTAAIIGGSLLGAGGSMLAAGRSGRAAERAADVQAQASQEAAQLQHQQFMTTRADMAPWMQAGQSALQQQQALLGLAPIGGGLAAAAPAPTMMGYDLSDPGILEQGYFRGQQVPRETRRSIRAAAREYQEGQAATPTAAPEMTASPTAPDYSAFFQSPGYQYQLEEGERAINRAAASQGLRMSGGTLAELQRHSQGLADLGYSDYYNRLAGLSGTGMTGAQSLGQFGAQAAGNIGQLGLAGAGARATGYQQGAQAFGQGIAGLGQSLGYGLGALATMPQSGMGWDYFTANQG